MDVPFSSDVAFFIEGSRYVGLILFEEGLDLFSPLVESSFRSLVLLLAVADLLFRPPLVMANGGVGSYVRFKPSEDIVDVLSAPFTPYSG